MTVPCERMVRHAQWHGLLVSSVWPVSPTGAAQRIPFTRWVNTNGSEKLSAVWPNAVYQERPPSYACAQTMRCSPMLGLSGWWKELLHGM